MENYRGQLSVSEQKISELKSSLYDSVTKNEELVASKDKKISVSKNVLIERNVYVRRVIGIMMNFARRFVFRPAI